MAIDIGREAEELVRYYSELTRRLPQNGVRDVSELIALFEQLRGALDAIGHQEIGWATEQTQRLVEALVRMDANLQALRRLKSALERPRELPGAGVSGRGMP
jgi:hypothetical protein